MNVRVQFSLAALMRCMLFAALSCGLLAAAFRPKGDEMDQFILVLLSMAAAGASLGSLLGCTSRAALIGLAVLPACYGGSIAFLVAVGLLIQLLYIETGWLKCSILAAPLTVLPACVLAIKRPRWGGTCMVLAGIVSAGAIILALEMPWLVGPMLDQSFRTASFILSFFLASATAALGISVVSARPKSKRSTER